MFIECPKCAKRINVEKSTKNLEMSCACGETIAIIPWTSYHQTVDDVGKVDCSVCNKTYNLYSYRNYSDIACNCGNIILIRLPKLGRESRGRRKDDQISKQLEMKLHGLIDTSRMIHSVRDLEKLLMLIVRVTSKMLDAEGSSVILTDEETGDLVIKTIVGPKSSKLTSFHLSSGEGIAGNCIKNEAAFIVNDVSKDSRFSERADKFSGFSTRSILCLPLMVKGECIGALEVVNKTGDEGFDDEDLFLGEAISSQIAVAIHNVQLTQAAIKAERLAAIGEAVTGVAHCVKNMLNGLMGGFSVIEIEVEEELGEVPQKGFGMVKRSLNNLKNLVQDMLTYSKDREPEYKSTDVNDLVNDVEELMQTKAREQETALSSHLDGKLNEIEIDPVGIYRSVLNLVSNALDACNSNGGAVDIFTNVTDENNTVIEVKDQGIGMDEETRQSIFKPFYSKKGAKGTGLGLAITNKIIQEHKGWIDVDSEPGVGSTFRIVLPSKRA